MTRLHPPDSRNPRFKRDLPGGFPYGEMTKVVKAVPVRKQGNAWIMTADHKAQAWALGIFRRGHSVELSKTRFPNRREAEGAVQAAQRALAGPVKGYKLGKRMSK